MNEFYHEFQDVSITTLYNIIELIIDTIMDPPSPIVATMPTEASVRQAILTRTLGTLIATDTTKIPNLEWILYHLYPILSYLVLPALEAIPGNVPLVFPITFDRGVIKFGLIIG